MTGRGFLSVTAFILWVSVVMSWLPGTLLDAKNVSLCGTIACCLGVMSISFLGRDETKHPFRNKYSFTFIHICILVAYILAAIATIGFVEMEQQEMKQTARGVIYFAVLPVLVFVVESRIVGRWGKNKGRK